MRSAFHKDRDGCRAMACGGASYFSSSIALFVQRNYEHRVFSSPDFFLSSIGLVRFVPILSVLHFVVVVFCWHFFYVNTEYNIFNVKYAL